MNYTNLNIKSNGKTFKYIVEYFDVPTVKPETLTYYGKDEQRCFFFSKEQTNVLAEKNYWDVIKYADTHEDSNIPSTYNVSAFDLYFPRYSVDTYERNVYYVLTLNTWINGRCVYLGSYLIDRKNAVAPSTGVRKFLNEEYYEYIRVETVDPFYLIYGDEWKNFRNYFCNEPVYDEGVQNNNTASNINVTLTPVKFVNGTWIKLDGYDSSQSALVINDEKDSNYFNAKLKFSVENGIPVFNCELIFNELYENNLEEYLLETYQLTIDEDFKIKYCFVIGDQENPYKYVEHPYTNAQTSSKFTLDEFVFDGWNDFIDGLYANVFVIIQKQDNDILVLNSNKVFITQEEFKYLMNQEIRKVDLNEITMTVNNYDVVNVIKNEIVSVERPNDYKANIIKPIFIKSQETDAIRLHRSVIENIAINLDAYKNKVNAFILKIGDTNYYEIGRINSGIIFKVIGSSLPEADGLYYILNEDGELVTTGNYTIV